MSTFPVPSRAPTPFSIYEKIYYGDWLRVQEDAKTTKNVPFVSNIKLQPSSTSSSHPEDFFVTREDPLDFYRNVPMSKNSLDFLVDGFTRVRGVENLLPNNRLLKGQRTTNNYLEGGELSEQWVCRYDKKVYNKKGNMKRHYETCHQQNEKRMKCLIKHCGFESPYRNSVKRHLIQIHKLTPPNVGRAPQWQRGLEIQNVLCVYPLKARNTDYFTEYVGQYYEIYAFEEKERDKEVRIVKSKPAAHKMAGFGPGNLTRIDRASWEKSKSQPILDDLATAAAMRRPNLDDLATAAAQVQNAGNKH